MGIRYVMRSTVGTRYAIISVLVFFVMRRVLYNTEPCRDTLTKKPIWTEMYGTLAYKYEH